MKCTYCGAEIIGSALCATCISNLDEMLRDVRPLLDELDITISRQSRMSDRLGIRSSESVLPYHIAASNAYRRLTDETVRIARQFASTRQSSVIVRRGNGRGCAAFLRIIRRMIVNNPEIGDMMRVLEVAENEAREVIDRSADSWYVGICSHEGCNADLYTPENASVVECPKCHTRHDVASRRAIMIDALEDVLATATEIGRAVHLTGNAVKPATIWQWRRRGKLISQGTNSRGEPLYRLGDVLSLVRK